MSQDRKQRIGEEENKRMRTKWTRTSDIWQHETSELGCQGIWGVALVGAQPREHGRENMGGSVRCCPLFLAAELRMEGRAENLKLKPRALRL